MLSKDQVTYFRDVLGVEAIIWPEGSSPLSTGSYSQFGLLGEPASPLLVVVPHEPSSEERQLLAKMLKAIQVPTAAIVWRKNFSEEFPESEWERLRSGLGAHWAIFFGPQAWQSLSMGLRDYHEVYGQIATHLGLSSLVTLPLSDLFAQGAGERVQSNKKIVWEHLKQFKRQVSR